MARVGPQRHGGGFLSRLVFEKYVTNFMKIRPVGAELFHADGQTDKQDEADGRYSHFC